EYLFEHETITGKEFMKIFREIKGLPDPEEEKDSSETEDDEKSAPEETKEYKSIFDDNDSKDDHDSIFDE
ncbi:MAG: hypothetical protein IKZ85_03705, partial [Pseudobutyrivibrio sp.]|nr:hypothetical protein [Pseudobutyrivibrio sp.]